LAVGGQRNNTNTGAVKVGPNEHAVDDDDNNNNNNIIQK
jgi:hypothetical protein